MGDTVGAFGAAGAGSEAVKEGGGELPFCDGCAFFRPSMALSKFKSANFSNNYTPFKLFLSKTKLNLLLKNID